MLQTEEASFLVPDYGTRFWSLYHGDYETSYTTVPEHTGYLSVLDTLGYHDYNGAFLLKCHQPKVLRCM